MHGAIIGVRAKKGRRCDGPPSGRNERNGRAARREPAGASQLKAPPTSLKSRCHTPRMAKVFRVV
ncbi:hypothetical protein FTUN_6838 [Frigoriglobus tundricola]|uniref:Uncharacterized protein n=1 Tax=Frigoriglobus tundricola TaxID=2774151 RepID=A0A6M5Z0G9_9BACT|nr:hypothetical protein FTUN_6838 [Frigoriglobus tundricola]